MIETSSEQKNDQNHDHDPITFRKEKIIYISNRETGE